MSCDTNHNYELTCKTCGQKGTIRVSIDPERAFASTRPAAPPKVFVGEMGETSEGFDFRRAGFAVKPECTHGWCLENGIGYCLYPGEQG